MFRIDYRHPRNKQADETCLKCNFLGLSSFLNITGNGTLEIKLKWMWGK